MARHGGTSKFRPPRLKGLLTRGSPGVHRGTPPPTRTAGDGTWYPTPAQWERLQAGESVKGHHVVGPSPRTRQRQPGAGARANIAARPPRQGDSFAGQVSRTPANREPTRTRRGIQRDADRGGPAPRARQQLEKRAAAKPGTPHPMSGEGARSNVKAKGTARRPASPMPGDPTPVAKGRRAPEGHGKSFAGSFFR